MSVETACNKFHGNGNILETQLLDTRRYGSNTPGKACRKRIADERTRCRDNKAKQAMNYRKLIGISITMLFAAISIAPAAGHAQQRHGVDRMHQLDRDRNYDRDRAEIREIPQDWDRLNLRDPSEMKDQDIYGYEYMTAEERKRYRDRLRNFDTSESRQEFQRQHEELVRRRALAQGGDLVPPGQGPVYGGELMTAQERNKYREQMRWLKAGKERQEFLARHRERMDERACALDYKIKEVE